MLAQLLVLAVLTEAATELVKDVTERGFTIAQLVALVFGQVAAWGVGLDFFSLVGIDGAPWLGYVGTAFGGLVISRGANYIHSLWDRIGAVGGGQGA